MTNPDGTPSPADAPVDDLRSEAESDRRADRARTDAASGAQTSDVVYEERVQRMPTLGTKISWLIGGLLLVAAIYFAFVPIQVNVSQGAWGCGSAFAGPADAFGAGLCGQVNAIGQYRAFAFGLASLVMFAGGTYLFGMDSKTVRRQRPLSEDF